MPLADYCRDFEPGLALGNMAELDSLLAQAIAAPVMRLHASLEEIRSDPVKRAEQYRAVGIFIDQHCHVLLALWDGDGKDMAAGGTAEVVTFKQNGIPLTVSGSARESLDASEIGPVIEVVTPRMKETSAAGQVAVRPWGRAVIKRYRGGAVRQTWRAVVEFFEHLMRRDDARGEFLAPDERRELEVLGEFRGSIDLTTKFNRDAAPLEISRRAGAPGPKPRLSFHRARSFRRRCGSQGSHGYGPAVVSSLRDGRHSGAGKAIAIKWDWKLLFGFGFVAFCCFAMFTHAGYLIFHSSPRIS